MSVESRISRAWLVAGTLLIVTLAAPFVQVEAIRWRLRREQAIGLKSADPAQRLSSTRVIGRLGPIGEPTLVDLLDDLDADVARAAAMQLVHAESRVVRAILDDLMLDRYAIATGGPRPHIIVLMNADDGTLIDDRLASPDPYVRSTAALCLFAIEHSQRRGGGVRYTGRPIPGLAGELDDALPIVVETLQDMLRRPDLDDQQRTNIAKKLCEIGDPGIEALVQSIDLGRPVSQALAYVGADAVTPVAHEATNREAPATRRRAAVRTLGSIFVLRGFNRRAGFARPDPVIARDALAMALEDPDRLVRLAALASLGQLGARARAATPAIARLVTDEDTRVRRAAIRSLGAIGSLDDVADVLVAALDDPDRSVRARAALTLKSWAQTSIPQLEEVAFGSSDRARQQAIAVLSAFGSASVPTFERLLARGPVDARRESARALRSIGASESSTIDALRIALDDDDVTVRAESMRALTEIGVIVEMREVFIEHFDDDPRVAVLAIRGIGMLGEEGRPAIPSLTVATTHENSLIRAISARSLGRVGATSDGVLTALDDASRDGNPTTSWEAIWALARLDSQRAAHALASVPHATVAQAAGEFGLEPRAAIGVLLDDGDDRRVTILDAHGRITRTIDVPEAARGLGRVGASILVSLGAEKSRLVPATSIGRIDEDDVYAPISLPDHGAVLAVCGRPDIGDLFLAVRSGGTSGAVLRVHDGIVSTLFEMNDGSLGRASLSATGDGHVILSTNLAVYRAPIGAEIAVPAPHLDSGGRVAADARSNRWAALQPTSRVHLFEGRRERRVVGSGTGAVALAYSPGGLLVMMRHVGTRRTLNWFDEDQGTWHELTVLPPGVREFVLIPPR